MIPGRLSQRHLILFSNRTLLKTSSSYLKQHINLHGELLNLNKWLNLKKIKLNYSNKLNFGYLFAIKEVLFLFNLNKIKQKSDMIMDYDNMVVT